MADTPQLPLTALADTWLAVDIRIECEDVYTHKGTLYFHKSRNLTKQELKSIIEAHCREHYITTIGYESCVYFDDARPYKKGETYKNIVIHNALAQANISPVSKPPLVWWMYELSLSVDYTYPKETTYESTRHK